MITWIKQRNFPGLPAGWMPDNASIDRFHTFLNAQHISFDEAEFTANRFSAAVKGAFASRSDDSTFQLNNDRNGGNSLLLPNHNLDFAYTKLDLYAVFNATSRVTFLTQLDNLLDQQHIGPIGYPGLPFAVRAGIKLRILGD